jgi:hypothetical protein
VYAKVWIEELSAPELKASDSSQIGSYFSTLPGEQRRNLMLLIICLERPWFCHVIRGPPRFYACYWTHNGRLGVRLIKRFEMKTEIRPDQ